MPKGLLGSDKDKVRKLEIHMTVVGKPVRKGLHGKPHTWKDNIKVNPHTVVCERVEWVQITQDENN